MEYSGILKGKDTPITDGHKHNITNGNEPADPSFVDNTIIDDDDPEDEVAAERHQGASEAHSPADRGHTSNDKDTMLTTEPINFGSRPEAAATAGFKIDKKMGVDSLVHPEDIDIASTPIDPKKGIVDPEAHGHPSTS